MKKLMVFQISLLIVFAGAFVGMLAGTDVYANIKSTIVDTTCFSCIKMDPVSEFVFTFDTVDDKPHPDFILENFNAIYKYGKKYLLDTLENRISGQLTALNNPYLKTSVKYKIASVEQFARSKSRQGLADHYLIGQPIRYTNVDYIYFVDEFFVDYIFAFRSQLSTAG